MGEIRGGLLSYRVVTALSTVLFLLSASLSKVMLFMAG
jgi:hypothetical protein